MKSQGLRTTIYKVSNMEAAKKWYSQAFETLPYFDEPFYIGFDIDGFELGLQPIETEGTEEAVGVISYWGVEDIMEAFEGLVSIGAQILEKPTDVGGDVKVAAVRDPWGNAIGIIFNPHFKV